MAIRLRSLLIRSAAVLGLTAAVGVPLLAPTQASAQWGYYGHPHYGYYHPYYHPYYRPPVVIVHRAWIPGHYRGPYWIPGHWTGY